MSKGRSELILAGDVGGTKTVLALFEPATSKRPGLKRVKLARYANSGFKGLDDIIVRFLRSAKRKPSRAAFALACPIDGDNGTLTNLGWKVSGKDLSRLIGVNKTLLFNDLVATALSIPLLDKKDLFTLQPGKPKDGNIGVIAAGTGLGEAVLVRAGKKLVPMATEGGHGDFAPRNQTEAQLLDYLTKIYGRVSYERVISGMGLENIYNFLKSFRGSPELAGLSEKIDTGDAPSVIADLALNKTDKDCMDALDMFVSLYGAEAGNLALRTLAHGGIYVGGGIAPKILSAMKTGAFIGSFRQKGRFEGFLSNIPVHVILNEFAPVIGAGAGVIVGGR